MREFPAWLASTLASDASKGQGVLPPSISSLSTNAQIVGPARVLLISQDDNLSVRQLLDERNVLGEPIPPGCVLVVAGGSTSRTATVGGLMALEMQNLGILGLVTDGLVRDARELREMERFHVWCRGVTPIASNKNGPAVIGGSVSVGETLIRDGDLVIADDDGVVIWPQEQIDDLLVRAEAKLQQDNARLAQLQKGE